LARTKPKPFVALLKEQHDFTDSFGLILIEWARFRAAGRRIVKTERLVPKGFLRLLGQGDDVAFATRRRLATVNFLKENIALRIAAELVRCVGTGDIERAARKFLRADGVVLAPRLR